MSKLRSDPWTRLAICTLVAGVVLFAIGCGTGPETPEQQLEGTWQALYEVKTSGEVRQSVPVSLSFNGDGTVEGTVTLFKDPMRLNGRWRMPAQNRMILTLETESRPMDLDLEFDRGLMTLTAKDGAQITFGRL